jgi:tetratricopeptide (TPR) repeat protein
MNSPVAPEIVSLLGVPYYATPATGEKLTGLEGLLMDAEAAHTKDPDDVQKLIEYGQRLAYMWRFRDAIAVFTLGISRFPDEAMLYRHRGHRYISIRQFVEAELDLKRASEIRGDSFDIWYHLGLARWLLGDYEGALVAYHACEKVTPGNNRWVALAYWMYLTLLRLDRKAEADALLVNLEPEDGANRHYYNILLYFRGDQSEANLGEMMKIDDTQLTTIGFGIGCHAMLTGNGDKAEDYYRKILTAKHWSSFGFITAEVEMARLGRSIGCCKSSA